MEVLQLKLLNMISLNTFIDKYDILQKKTTKKIDIKKTKKK